MSKTREQIEKELDQNIPREVVAQRSGGGTKSLSYLETWYVIDRLNKVFGNMGWESETTEMLLVSGSDALPAYRAKVRITVSTPEHDASGTIVGFRNVVKEGTGWGSDKSKLNPHEMACKEAESDALKRAAMKLGISMGLGLYDKSGEFVDDAVPETKSETPKSAPKLDRKAINDGIAANAKTAVARGIYKDIPEFQAFRKEKYGVDTTDALSDTQANELLNILKQEQKNGKRN